MQRMSGWSGSDLQHHILLQYCISQRQVIAATYALYGAVERLSAATGDAYPGLSVGRLCCVPVVQPEKKLT